ncbi:MAG: GNAT family N-acetyltransferase [Lactobacillales bacterium]|jgi:ribosomal protein S18 acetylase RimI-like enzyme|nr:GNAT family N-acetyltransferase [Lactobacillales bacterium]
MKLKRITIEQSETVRDLAEQSRELFVKLGGGEPTKNSVKSMFELLPPDKTNEDKYSLLILDKNEPVGFIDVVKGFPTESTWFIGLFFLVPKSRGQGKSQTAYQKLVAFIKENGGEKIRLTVAEQNLPGLRFWQKNGFEEIEFIPDMKIAGQSVPSYKMEVDIK